MTNTIMLCSFILLLLSALTATTGHEVPMKKAIPPLMDPIPTLPEITHRVFLEIEMGGKTLGKVVFGLFGHTVPKTVENFLSLAKCNHGVGKKSGKELCYTGTTFHRIVNQMFVQGGDISHDNGVGGESIYGGTFEDENFEVNHNRPYMLSMSNCGERDCNGSQFIITLAKTQWLNGKHVAFGVVLEGHDVLEQVESKGTYGGKPLDLVKIANSGEEPLKPEDKETHY